MADRDAAVRALIEEEQVIRDWLAGQLRESGAPLPPSLRTSQPLPRRQVAAVVQTLLDLLDEARRSAPVVEAARWHLDNPNAVNVGHSSLRRALAALATPTAPAPVAGEGLREAAEAMLRALDSYGPRSMAAGDEIAWAFARGGVIADLRAALSEPVALPEAHDD